jgi:hypothetical protein
MTNHDESVRKNRKKSTSTRKSGRHRTADSPTRRTVGYAEARGSVPVMPGAELT